MTALAVELFNEARRQWALDARHDSLAAVAGLNLLSMASITHGRDDLSKPLIEEGLEMGRRLGLFGSGPEFASSASDWLGEGSDHARTKAASYTAWGVFNWTVSVPPLAS